MKNRPVTIEDFPEDQRETILKGFEDLERIDRETPEMSPEEFKRAIHLLYEDNDKWAVADLGLSDSRIIRRYRSGERKVPPGLARELRAFISLKESEENGGPDYHAVIGQLQKAGELSGMPVTATSAAILGAAKSNARRNGLNVEITILGDENGK